MAQFLLCSGTATENTFTVSDHACTSHHKTVNVSGSFQVASILLCRHLR
jgi:hypothetical protein